jgi:hypothetical protein
MLSGFDNAHEEWKKTEIGKVEPDFKKELQELCNKYKVSIYTGCCGAIKVELSDGYLYEFSFNIISAESR